MWFPSPEEDRRPRLQLHVVQHKHTEHPHVPGELTVQPQHQFDQRRGFHVGVRASGEVPPRERGEVLFDGEWRCGDECCEKGFEGYFF